MIASVVSVAIGNAWGGAALLLGLAQGLALEAGFAVRRYRSFSGVTVVVAGLLGGITQGILEVLNLYAGATAAFTGIYVASAAVSGVVLAGGFSVVVLRSVKSTGVLRQFGHV
jgi:energy-coupling factor transport system substrate-specific component